MAELQHLGRLARLGRSGPAQDLAATNELIAKGYLRRGEMSFHLTERGKKDAADAIRTRPRPAAKSNPRGITAISHRDLMLATPAPAPFSREGWIYEIKYDGDRCLASKLRDVVRLESRNGRDMAACFPEIVAEIRAIPHDFVVDGEIVILDAEGRPHRDRLRKRHALRSDDRIRLAAEDDPAVLFAFDLLYLNGADFRPRRLLDRKAALLGILPGNRRIRYTKHLGDSVTELWQFANEMNLDGIVEKDGNSPYVAGRSNSWKKVKTVVGVEREKQRRPR